MLRAQIHNRHAERSASEPKAEGLRPVEEFKGACQTASGPASALSCRTDACMAGGQPGWDCAE